MNDAAQQVAFFESTTLNSMVPRQDLLAGSTRNLLANAGFDYIAYAPLLFVGERIGVANMPAGTYQVRFGEIKGKSNDGSSNL